MKRKMFILLCIIVLMLCFTVKSEKKSKNIVLEEIICKPDSYMLPEINVYGKIKK